VHDHDRREIPNKSMCDAAKSGNNCSTDLIPDREFLPTCFLAQP